MSFRLKPDHCSLVWTQIQSRIESNEKVLLILSEFLNESPEKIKIQRTSRGKPFIRGAALSFNISHTKNWLCVGVCANEPLGLDIEIIQSRPLRDRVAEKVFPQKIYFQWNELPEGPRKHEAFFVLWTSIEAWIKAHDLRLVDWLQTSRAQSGNAWDFDPQELRIQTSESDLKIEVPQNPISKDLICAIALSRRMTQIESFRI